MSNPLLISGPTSNDLLESFIEENAQAELNYQFVGQSLEDAQDMEDASAVRMEPYSTSPGSEEPSLSKKLDKHGF